MSREETMTNDRVFYSVIDGTFRVQVSENDPDAVARHWETKDGKSGTKYEKHVKALFGEVQTIAIHDTDYGKNLNISLDPNEDGKTPVISVGVDSRYGGDLLKRLPNLQQGVEYRFMPYAFIPDDSDKEKRGVAVHSKDRDDKFTVQVGNFFTDGEKNLHGFPEATEEDKEDWAFYFKKVTKFLVKYAEENVVPRFAEKPAEPLNNPTSEEEGINPDDIPF